MGRDGGSIRVRICPDQGENHQKPQMHSTHRACVFRVGSTGGLGRRTQMSGETEALRTLLGGFVVVCFEMVCWEGAEERRRRDLETIGDPEGKDACC